MAGAGGARRFSFRSGPESKTFQLQRKTLRKGGLSQDTVMVCHHDLGLVVLSIFVSILAAFAARELLGRINQAQGRVWLAWLAGTAVIDGIGTWSMHYTAKLACHLPMPLLFDWRMVLLSLLVGISGTAATVFVLARHKFGWGRAIVGSILLGGWAVSGLHFVSMAAIVRPAPQSHFSPFVIGAVLLAIAVSLAAIALAFRFPDAGPRRRLRKHASSILRGTVNPVMHYSAMAGVTFGSGEGADLSHAVGIGSLGILGICIVPVMILIVGLITSLADRLQNQGMLLRRFSRQLVEVQETERRRLARELHDEIGQALTAAKINLQSGIASAGAAVSARLHDTIAILDRLLGQVRQISLDLRPSMLDDLGLVPALRSLLNDQGRRAAIAVDFSGENIPGHIDPEIQTACFRIAQEAITNALRHARATQIWVRLRGDDGELRLLIRDNGIGFEVESAPAQTVGLGLIGIKERADLLGGRTEIVSSPNQGTTIEVFLPLIASR
jgi:signal transduction histidine kinase